MPTDMRGQNPLDPVKSLEFQISAINSSISRYNSQLESYKKQLDRLKNTPADNRTRAAIQAQMKFLNDKLGVAKSSLATKQNSLYQQTGQYEKLLQGTERDAFMAINALFKSYGLDSLAGKIFDYVKNGYSADTISILLQDTKEYKQRFAGNELRTKAGLPVLSPSEYLATEASYRQILSSAGLPTGFYDSPSDFNNWIAGNVSPSEIKERVDLATQATVLAPPFYKEALKRMGIPDSELVAYFLDQKKALPLIQKSAATAAIGAASLAQGMSFDQAYAESLATRGITSAQAQEGYAQIGAEMEDMARLGDIYGEDWTQRTAEEATFEGKSEAVAKKKRLASQERGAFSGSAGAARGAFARRGGQY